MSDSQRLTIELGKLKVSVATIKKQINNDSKRLRKLKVPMAIINPILHTAWLEFEKQYCKILFG